MRKKRQQKAGNILKRKDSKKKSTVVAMLRSTLRRVASSAAARLQSRQQVHINRVFPTPAGKRFLSTTPAAAATAGSDLGGGGLEVVTPLTVQPGQLDATGTFDTWWPVDPLGHFIEVSWRTTLLAGSLLPTAIQQQHISRLKKKHHISVLSSLFFFFSF